MSRRKPIQFAQIREYGLLEGGDEILNRRFKSAPDRDANPSNRSRNPGRNRSRSFPAPDLVELVCQIISYLSNGSSKA